MAIEVKRSGSVGSKDLKGLQEFSKDYPEARLLFFYGGTRKEYRDGIQIIPIDEALGDLESVLAGNGGAGYNGS